MPKSLSKVQKHIAKKKGKNTALHENSRDSLRLQRAAARDDKLTRLASAREKQNRPHLQRITFIRAAIADKPDPLTPSEVHTLIQQYLRRDDEELTRLKAERRPGRPSSTREDLIKQKQEQEEREYVSGFWLPDLESQDNLSMLKLWDGDWVGLNTVKFVRVAKSGAKHESTFPPKGQS